MGFNVPIFSRVTQFFKNSSTASLLWGSQSKDTKWGNLHQNKREEVGCLLAHSADGLQPQPAVLLLPWAGQTLWRYLLEEA